MKDGGPAFPQGDRVSLALSIADSQGMTLRDYFAGMAMQGMLSAFPNVANTDKRKFAEEMPVVAYEYADAIARAEGEQT